jgi:hypothetical protein
MMVEDRGDQHYLLWRGDCRNKCHNTKKKKSVLGSSSDEDGFSAY